MRIGYATFAALVVGLAVLSAWLVQDPDDVHDMAPFGLPHAREYALNTVSRTLINPGFTVGYSEWRSNPLWVVYRLAPIRERRSYPRPRHYETDARSWRAVSPDAFRRSGYQRGHLAPNFAISQVHGRDAQRATFLMSNVSPQKSRLNQKAWQRLEEAVIDHFTPRFGTLWVTAGPIFAAKTETLASGVEVPDAFYKILLVRSSGEAPRVLAFRMSQQVRGDEALSRFLVSVDALEQETGLDFFADLPDDIESRIEAGVETEAWDLASVDRLPARY
ncbi:MAG: DNA/RNA non-specific endonuclease [Gammaproteobacteria bacterium]|nr:DNA/RNA non-specific endonuclease [Gammaproteobacteria bacterium]MCP5137545.1 DNA/RNA non-specific endonuclease [Gammaproteobacteria bacterium]